MNEFETPMFRGSKNPPTGMVAVPCSDPSQNPRGTVGATKSTSTLSDAPNGLGAEENFLAYDPLRSTATIFADRMATSRSNANRTTGYELCEPVDQSSIKSSMSGVETGTFDSVAMQQFKPTP